MSNNTLKYLFAVILPLIVGQLFVSCKYGNPMVDVSLDRIEQVVQQRPDSALLELVRLDSLLDAGAVHIEGDRQMARYALLKTQTHDKNYIDDTSDSLILRAVRYYDEHGSKREQMLSHYYHGAIFRNAANFSQAYSSFLLAAKLATDYGDNTYAGLSYGNVSCICRSSSFSMLLMASRRASVDVGSLPCICDHASILVCPSPKVKARISRPS